MGKFRGLDKDEGWIKRRFAKIEKQMREDRAAKRLAASTIEAGGSLLVRGLLKVIGNVSMVSADGAELFRLGDMEFGRGVEFKRDDGSYVIRIRKPFSNSDNQTIEILDRNSDVLVTESSITNGLGRPHLEMPFQPVAASSATAVQCGPYGFERTHNSSTWTTIFAYDGKGQNAFIDLKFAAMCSDGSTAAEIQIINLDTGFPLSGFLGPAYVGTVPAGTTTMTVVDPSATAIATLVAGSGLGSVGMVMRLGIQVRRTAGTGTITLAVPSSIGA